jgi:hypothetical protein
MTRCELVQRLVLNTICDDYENVDQVILRSVAKAGAELGLTIERSEIVNALAELISRGLAKAYALSSSEPFSTEIRGMPPLDVIEDTFTTYFYIAKEGMDLHHSDDTWLRFDDQGRPLN